MTLDVSVIAAQGADIMAAAIKTSGTTVDLYVDPDDLDETVDFETLEITDATPSRATASNLPALIISEGSATENVGPGRDTRPGIYRVALLPSAPDVPEGAILLVRRCPNSRLVNAQLQIDETVDDAFGLAQTLRATRLS